MQVATAIEFSRVRQPKMRRRWVRRRLWYPCRTTDGDASGTGKQL
jgi:hypothetical protein